MQGGTRRGSPGFGRSEGILVWVLCLLLVHVAFGCGGGGGNSTLAPPGGPGGGAGDTTPPSIAISSPAAGATVSGVVTISVTVSDNQGVAGVQFRVDGANAGAEVTQPPFSYAWDTTVLANGSHTLGAVARDAAGNTTASAAVSVSVSNVSPGRTITLSPSNADATCNEEFENVANTLQPGDTLILRGGIYSQNCRRAITANGTAGSPITIRAATGETPILTRPLDNIDTQNNIEIVNSSHLVIRGIKFRGGSIGVRLMGTSNNITFEDNEIYEVGANAFAANSGNSDALILRRNHIHDTGLSTEETEGEGMYLGCNNNSCRVSNSLIENNYIHHTRGTSGGGNDGIELKVGSGGNTVRNNVIHDTITGQEFPCIFVYGGAQPNLVEGNVLWNCGEAIQVVSDAIIRSNLILGSTITGITAGPHTQVATMKDVTIVHNTVFGHPECISVDWDTATNMTLANNAFYCPGETAVNASGLARAGITVRNNYVAGGMQGATIDSTGFFAGGSAAAAFVDPSARNFWPAAGSPLRGTALAGHAPAQDFNGTPRTAPFDVGAYESEGQAANPGWQVQASFKGDPPLGPDTAAPTVSILQPAAGQSVSGLVALTALASDNVHVTGLQFKVDGVNIENELRNAPFVLVWDTATVLNGTRTLAAVARDAAGNTATTTVVNVVVSNAPDVTPPALNAITASPAATTAVITWATNELADTQAEYGTTAAYGQSSPLGTLLANSHMVTLTALTPGTTYHFRVKSRDLNGNLGSSADLTFQTLAQAPAIPETLGWFRIPNSKLVSVCPPNTAQYEFSDFCRNVVDAWGGAIADVARNRMIIWGGGHKDYAGNEVYALNLSDLSMARLNDPSPINTSGTCLAALSDGRPNSRHTYSGLAYVAHANRMYAFSGSLTCNSGNAADDTWMLNLANLEWQRMDPTNGAKPTSSFLFNMVSDYDPHTQKVLMHDRKNLWTYDFATNTYTEVHENVSSVLDANGVIDPKRKLFFVVGEGIFHVYDIRPGRGYPRTNLASQVTGCGPLINAVVPGLAYDPVQDRIVGWAGGDTVYLFNPDTRTCTPVTFPGGPGAANSLGTYGRWRYFPGLGVFALVNDAEQDAFTLRMTPPPSSTSSVAKPR